MSARRRRCRSIEALGCWACASLWLLFGSLKLASPAPMVDALLRHSHLSSRSAYLLAGATIVAEMVPLALVIAKTHACAVAVSLVLLACAGTAGIVLIDTECGCAGGFDPLQTLPARAGLVILSMGVGLWILLGRRRQC